MCAAPSQTCDMMKRQEVSGHGSFHHSTLMLRPCVCSPERAAVTTQRTASGRRPWKSFLWFRLAERKKEMKMCVSSRTDALPIDARTRINPHTHARTQASTHARTRTHAHMHTKTHHTSPTPCSHPHEHQSSITATTTTAILKSQIVKHVELHG
jgi:hypothetical protein